MLKKEYLVELLKWRKQLEDNLRGEQSWLSLVGLYWLDQGNNRFGSHPSNDVVFPKGISPPHLLSIELSGGRIFLHAYKDQKIDVDGKIVLDKELKLDVSGKPSLVEAGRLTMIAVKRGERYGLRVWDKNNPRRDEFSGRIWFEPLENYVVKAKFSTYDSPKEIPIVNILGDTTNSPLAGYIEFALFGNKARLQALEGADNGLFLIFKDETSNSATYAAGRYIHTDEPKQGVVTLDFNRAYNPPCAFTDFATCPLPPAENNLPFQIEAGERIGNYFT